VVSGSTSQVMSWPSGGNAAAIMSALKPVKVPSSSTRRAPTEATSIWSSVPSTWPDIISARRPIRSQVSACSSASSGGKGVVCATAYSSMVAGTRVSTISLLDCPLRYDTIGPGV
jgi:hypothetical protein